MTVGRCFAVLAGVALGGLAVGALASLALGLAVSAPAAACLVAAAVLTAALGTPILRRMLPVTVAPAADDADDRVRRLRHDVRGALSPALLTADRLLNHADPAVQRGADIMVRAVEKAAGLLADPPKPGAIPPDRR